LFEAERLVDAIVNLEEETALQLSRQMLEAGKDPVEIFETCRKGMEKVGERFESGEYFLSELIMSAEIFKGIMEIVGPQLKKANVKSLGKVLIGTVQRDIHYIGKNLVIALLEVAGFEVIDLGEDVPPGKFVEAIREHKPDIVGMSGLLTMAIESMKNTVDAIKEAGLRNNVRIIIGGGRVNEDAYRYVGADAWADNASKGVKICKELIAG
jgi:methanogenic corrinoid protein MtbC1